MKKRRSVTRKRPAARRRTPAGWSRHVEAATLRRSALSIDPAREAFLRLAPKEQLQLVQELVTTRRGELTRAYVDVISVAAGHRVRHDDAGRPTVDPEVCVTVVVKEKKGKARVPAARRVPDTLFAYWTVGDERVLCAVRTDVEDGAVLRAIRPLAQVEAVSPKSTASAPGVIACAVQRADGVYAISCRHVFGMALLLAPPVDDAEVRAVGDATPFGGGTDSAGRLVNGLEYSFDAQLMKASNEDRLQAALGEIIYASRALGWDDLIPGRDCWIHTWHGRVRAQYAARHVEPIEYSPMLNDIRHRALARFITPDGGVRPGDSGSPVMSARGGGKLLGMLIASNVATHAVAIPAWQLLQPENYNLRDGPWDFWPPQP